MFRSMIFFAALIFMNLCDGQDVEAPRPREQAIHLAQVGPSTGEADVESELSEEIENPHADRAGDFKEAVRELVQEKFKRAREMQARFKEFRIEEDLPADEAVSAEADDAHQAEERPRDVDDSETPTIMEAQHAGPEAKIEIATAEEDQADDNSSIDALEDIPHHLRRQIEQIVLKRLEMEQKDRQHMLRSLMKSNHDLMERQERSGKQLGDVLTNQNQQLLQLAQSQTQLQKQYLDLQQRVAQLAEQLAADASVAHVSAGQSHGELVTEHYTVADLLVAGPDELEPMFVSADDVIAAMKGMTNPEIWNHGAEMHVHPRTRLLTVRAAQSTQKAIRDQLMRFRRPGADSATLSLQLLFPSDNDSIGVGLRQLNRRTFTLITETQRQELIERFEGQNEALRQRELIAHHPLLNGEPCYLWTRPHDQFDELTRGVHLVCHIDQDGDRVLVRPIPFAGDEDRTHWKPFPLALGQTAVGELPPTKSRSGQGDSSRAIVLVTLSTIEPPSGK